MNNKLLMNDYIILMLFMVMIVTVTMIATYGFARPTDIISVYTPQQNSLSILAKLPSSQMIDHNPHSNVTMIKITDPQDFQTLKETNSFIFKSQGGALCRP